MKSVIFNKSTRGFTLVELLVVISIIGMLSSVALVALQGAKDKGAVAAGLKFATYNYRGFGSDAIGLWNFNEASGASSYADSSANNNTAFPGGSITPTSGSGPNNSAALIFNDGYVRATNAKGMPTSANFTISAWINPTSQCAGANDCYGVSIGNTSNQGVVISNRDLKLTFTISGGSFYSGTNSSLVLNKWQHVAVAISGTTAKYYINGQLKDTVTIGTISNISTWASGNIYIGSWLSAAQPFKGSIDDVAIYPVSLAASDIEDIYAQGLSAHGFATAR